MMSAIEGDDRPTMPAINSKDEAEHWLLVECIGPNGDQAREVRKALALGRPCDDVAVEWLEDVASSRAIQAGWARLILGELRDRDLLVPVVALPRSRVSSLFAALRRSVGCP